MIQLVQMSVQRDDISKELEFIVENTINENCIQDVDIKNLKKYELILIKAF